MKQEHLDLLSCIKSLETVLEFPIESETPLSDDLYFVALDYLKLLYCSESWNSLIDFSSSILSKNLVEGVRVASFYHYWLTALNELHDVPGMESLTGHLISLPEGKSVSYDRLKIILTALCWTNQKVSARMVLRRLEKAFPHENHFYAHSIYQHYLGTQTSTKTPPFEFLEKAPFLDLATVFHLKPSQSMCDFLLENYPYFSGSYLYRAKTAITQQNWKGAYKWLNILFQWFPQNQDALLGLSFVYHQMGDHFFAYNLLDSYRHEFDDLDLDYSSLMGKVSQKIYQNYGLESYRERSLKELKNHKALSSSLGLKTLGVKSRLRSLGISFDDAKERRDPLDHVGQRSWLIQLIDVKRRLLEKSSDFYLLAPRFFKKGDQVFLGELTDDERFSVSVWYEITENPLSEKNKLFYVQLKKIEDFHQISFQPDECLSSGGKINFKESLSEHMKVYELSSESVNWIKQKAQVENTTLKKEERAHVG